MALDVPSPADGSRSAATIPHDAIRAARRVTHTFIMP